MSALETAIRGDAVLDGEIVAIDPDTGLSSFARLQQRMQLRDAVRAARTGVAVRLYLFDCLHYEGVDLTDLPLVDRKKVLRDVVWFDDPIHFTPHRTTGVGRHVPGRLCPRRRGDHRQAGRLAVRGHPVGRLAQDQVRACNRNS